MKYTIYVVGGQSFQQAYYNVGICIWILFHGLSKLCSVHVCSMGLTWMSFLGPGYIHGTCNATRNQ